MMPSKARLNYKAKFFVKFTFSIVIFLMFQEAVLSNIVKVAQKKAPNV